MKKILLVTALALSLGAAAPLAAAADWHDNNPHAEWNPKQHNGYWMNNHWHFGAPPHGDYNKPGFSLGWHDWQRGERVPAAERHRYARLDWRAHHLRRPPRGYYWLQDDRGNFILAAVATGLIADAIINSH